jgi:protoporphyrinogen oxidase
MKRIAIVGGGMLGLQLANKLSQEAETSVTLFESAKELGGLAAAWQLHNVTWDKHYHVMLLSDAHVRDLLAELDLENEVDWVTTRTGFYTDGKLVSMSNSLEFLRFPPLGLIDKFRLALTIMKASRIKNWHYLEDITVEAWLRKWSGPRTLEKIWKPLLRAKLGEQYKIASAAFIWAIIARMYAARKSGLKQEKFGCVRGGYARILERLGEKLHTQGVNLRLGEGVREIERTSAGLCVHTKAGDTETFDEVILTANTHQASRMVPGLTSTEKKTLEGITYQGIVCASVLLKKPLAPYYVTNITDTWVPFTAVIEMTTLLDPKHLDDQYLVYLPKYVAADDPLFEESDASIRSRFLGALAKMYPHFSESDVLAFQLSRVRQVFAVNTLGYSRHVPATTTSIPGLSLVTSAQIVNGTLNVNETLALANNFMATRKQAHEVSANNPVEHAALASDR